MKRRRVDERDQIPLPLPAAEPPKRPRGRLRIHPDRKAAQRAASAAYRARKRARRECPDIIDHGILDLSAIALWRIRRVRASGAS